MGGFAAIYAPSLSLLTDLYQLTMAFGYWKSGIHQAQAVFRLHFRRNPFGARRPRRACSRRGVFNPAAVPWK